MMRVSLSQLDLTFLHLLSHVPKSMFVSHHAPTYMAAHPAGGSPSLSLA